MSAARNRESSGGSVPREQRSVPSGNAGPHDSSELNAATLNASHEHDAARDGETRAPSGDEQPEKVALSRTEQTRALGDVALPGDDAPTNEKGQRPDSSNAPDLTQNIDRDGDFRKPDGVEGGRVDDAATLDDKQRAAERERVQAARMPAVGSAEGAGSIFPERLLRAAYNELKDEVPSLSWDKFNRAMQHSARLAHGSGHPVTDEGVTA